MTATTSRATVSGYRRVSRPTIVVATVLLRHLVRPSWLWNGHEIDVVEFTGQRCTTDLIEDGRTKTRLQSHLEKGGKVVLPWRRTRRSCCLQHNVQDAAAQPVR